MHKYVEKTNGAFVLGNDIFTAQPIEGHFDRFGDGLFKATIGSFTPFESTFHKVSTDPGYKGHVIMVLGTAKSDDEYGKHMFIDLGPRKI
jgi:hypothetical protein